MVRDYFMKTRRIGFSQWGETDFDLATQLWGDAEVTRFLCASGSFTPQEIRARLETELQNREQNQIQYWPVFDLSSTEFLGCCGLRPVKGELHTYELGFHLRKPYWGMGYAGEAAKAVIDYSVEALNAEKLYAGHHPQNSASEKLLKKLGFRNAGASFYEPTGLLHPSYELVPEKPGEIRYQDTVKDLPSDRLRQLFRLVGWSDGTETPEQAKNFNVGFIHSTLVVSAWDKTKLVGAVRVLSDQIFHSVIYDLLVDPEYQGRGIGRDLVSRCIRRYPDSEWLVQTTHPIAGFYENHGFQVDERLFLSIPCKLFPSEK